MPGRVCLNEQGVGDLFSALFKCNQSNARLDPRNLVVGGGTLDIISHKSVFNAYYVLRDL